MYEAVWKEPGDKCGSAVTNVVSQIRRKIGDGYIETVVGSGYRFVEYRTSRSVIELFRDVFISAF
ncbi:MAG: winged helix-turn-helix domain-containing protein [Lachnospiraceae bacterium]|nr:winged helix-turn-helix domain-containing protein [Lachnospiraceae bacterium]